MKVHLADRTEGVVLDRVGMEPECLLAEMGKANIDGAHKQINKKVGKLLTVDTKSPRFATLS